MVPSFRWKRVFPRAIADRLATTFSICEIWVEGLELMVIVPRRYPDTTMSYWLSVMLGIFLFANTLSNFIMAVGIDISSGNTTLPFTLKPGCSYCHQCQQNSPPRSRHCSHCGTCVLKRDHHCIFMGRCIGHANQRYYLMCIMYISLLTIYASYHNMDIAVESITENFNLKTLFASFAPVFGWVYGLTQPVSYFIAYQSATCVYCFFIFTALFIYHWHIALRGQTNHEYRRINDRSYDLGLMQNIREVLGTRWYLVWIFPLIKSPLPGDGIHFRKLGTSSLEEDKDL